MKKKILAITLCIAMLAIAIVGGTLAYFTDSEAEKNEFVVGNVDIKLEEEFDSETPLLPGDHTNKENHVDKIVTIENTGNTPAYVRLLIAYEDTYDVGAMAFFDLNEPYATHGVLSSAAEDNFVVPYTGNDFLQIKDTDTGVVYTVGYVTVSEALAVGESVEILQSLAIKAGADNDWARIVGEKYDVLVLAQGTQVITDKTATESIDTAFGFTMDEKAGDYVAKLFTQAGLGTFENHEWSDVPENWVAENTTWDAVVNHPTPGIGSDD